MKHVMKLIAFAAVAILAASCSTTKKATTASSVAAPGSSASAAEIYKQQVVSNFQTAECLTARASITLKAGEKDFSVGGSLKMKRNDVIQLSLTFLGFEVGRMEFTTTDVLIVDKINKQYVRAAYNQASFLESAGLDFYSLQALFWNEIFSPGTHDVASALANFSVATSGDHTLLTLTAAPKLDYSFLTITKNAQLDRTTVTPKDVTDNQTLVCKYSNFIDFEGKKFPSRINLSFTGGKKDLGLDVRLSSLSDDSSWSTRTKVPASYKERSVDEIIDKLSTLR